MKTLILTPIAERDVHFYLATAQKLKSMVSVNIVFLSFYQPGNDLIKEAGYPVYDPYPNQKTWWPKEKLQSEYGTLPMEHLILHEKLTFGISSNEICFEKLEHMFPAVDALLEKIEKDFPGEKYVVQELAGFLSPLSLFYVAMKRGWKHYFTEPSFFKGRIHLLLNSLFLHIPDNEPKPESTRATAEYLSDALKNKVVVAATKDAHHYKDMGFAKVFNPENFKKISKKLYYKYVKGEKQEFDHIWNHSQRYLQMLRNRLKNSSRYSHLADLTAGQKYLYFPFHVQLDFSLTIRCPDRLDQLGLIEEALKHLPSNTVLIAKEHPASIGCLDQTRLEKVLSNPQFRLMHPQINSHDILDRCHGVLTINSKVGAEALSRGLPVISFGAAFYTDHPSQEKFKDWTQFKKIVQTWTDSTNPVRPVPAEWTRFLGQVFDHSKATELYELSPKNVENFAHAIAGYIR